MAGVDEIIRQWVQQVEATGELRKDPGFGKPFRFEDGYLETPEELRMVQKILKNAGYRPAEVELLQRIALLKEQLAATTDERERESVRSQLAELGQQLGIMLDKLRGRR
jgi:hypothetical protein